MSEPLLVRHPAFVSYVPRRGRNLRSAFVRIETPASPRQVAPGAFEPLRDRDGSDSGLPLRLLDGMPWAPLTVADGTGRVTPGEFAAFLRGNLREGEVHDSLVTAFRRTPLVGLSMRDYGGGYRMLTVERGVAVDLDGARSFSHDGRVAGAARLASWLSEEVAVSGDAVWTRVRPLARLVGEGQQREVGLVLRPHSVPGVPPLFSAGALEAGISAYRKDWERPPRLSENLERYLRSGPLSETLDDDAEYLANGFVWEVFEVGDRNGNGTLRPKAELAPVRERLAPFRVAAMTGGVDPAASAEVVRRLHEAAVRLGDNRDNAGGWCLGAMRPYLESTVLPRLDAREDRDADEMAAAFG